jgi:hypothetical protein
MTGAIDDPGRGWLEPLMAHRMAARGVMSAWHVGVRAEQKNIES